MFDSEYAEIARVISTIPIDTDGVRILGVYTVVNPEKLEAVHAPAPGPHDH